MKKIKTYGLIILLVFAVFLSSCGTNNTPAGAENNNPSGYVASDTNSISPTNSPDGTPAIDPLVNVIGYGFVKDNQYTYDKEIDGYSCQIVVDTWLGKQSDNNQLAFHPANNNLAIPLETATDCVIPFMATITTTTENTTFLTDVHFKFRSGRDTNTNMSNNIKITYPDMIEDALERLWDSSMLTYYWPNVWSGYLDRYEKTATGDEFVIYGYYIIPDHYSPANPNGNPDIAPEALTLLLNAGFDSRYFTDSMDISAGQYVGDFVIPLQIED